MLQKILLLCKTQYDRYATTIEEDNKILLRTDLTFNERNCVLYRHGEKEILIFLMKTANTMLELLEMDFKVRSV